MRHLAPGSQLPLWIEQLDTVCFGDGWGTLEASEHLWASAHAYARWRVVEAAQEAELLRLAVDPAQRREGQGRSLLRHCATQLAGMGVATLYLEVRVSNQPARRLYASEGWVFQGSRRAYYRDGEDAALYALTLGGDR